ncbi:serine--tRNA ligase [Columbia Basin potato purple top phytoplasma]|uniref:Serine--tRNA ligase n=1 Tax=Columbia Basin potato purple top phytoplasma TaxID=307134 RepID=A0ABT5L9X3_9MOLU|nr:serine--tRNA ligase [Columbia Basin potato purple top phytoplasma]MDC9031996.1 serine--tRNA ligase [Columbia Basin potato purple top phytoplasma]
MLDFKFVLSNMNLVCDKLKKRGIDSFFLEQLIHLDKNRKNLIYEIDKLRFRKNNLTKNITELKQNNKLDYDFLKKEKIFKNNLKELEKQYIEVKKNISDILYNIPNLPHDSVPFGTDEKDNIEISRFSEPKKMSFCPKDHIQLGINLDILDFEKGVKITGSKFVVLKGLGAKLERALINFMIDTHILRGYTEIFPPFIVNEESMFASGQLPKFQKELFQLKSNKQNWYLNPTAEVPMINLHRNEILNTNQLPLKYVCYTTCFRQESGAAGTKSKGLLRQKQFNKVELIQFVEPQHSYLALEKILEDSEYILKQLKLPYRVVVLSTGDLGFSMSKTYDIEVWLPGQNKYCEIASISNAEDFQSRRANIKFMRDKNDKKQYLHTLNGSALAIGRTMMAIMENYQDEKGNIVIPQVLQNYMQNIELIK